MNSFTVNREAICTTVQEGDARGDWEKNRCYRRLSAEPDWMMMIKKTRIADSPFLRAALRKLITFAPPLSKKIAVCILNLKTAGPF